MSDLSELIRRLRIGAPMKPSRWSGDTHADDGGEYEIEQADALMMEAADALIEVQASRKLIADLRALHVAEVDDDDESPTQGETFCVNCEHENPCPTIRMIDEAGL